MACKYNTVPETGQFPTKTHIQPFTLLSPKAPAYSIDWAQTASTPCSFWASDPAYGVIDNQSDTDHYCKNLWFNIESSYGCLAIRCPELFSNNDYNGYIILSPWSITCGVLPSYQSSFCKAYNFPYQASFWFNPWGLLVDGAWSSSLQLDILCSVNPSSSPYGSSIAVRAIPRWRDGLLGSTVRSIVDPPTINFISKTGGFGNNSCSSQTPNYTMIVYDDGSYSLT